MSVSGILNYITVSEIKHFSWLYITDYVINIWTSHASCHPFHFFWLLDLLSLIVLYSKLVSVTSMQLAEHFDP
jgi:hypothetical protein